MSFEILKIDVLRENYEGDEDILLSARDTFLKSWPQLINAIEEAAQTNKMKQLADSCHALKGSVSIFWPRDVTEILGEIENADEYLRLACYTENKLTLDRNLALFKMELEKLLLEDLQK